MRLPRAVPVYNLAVEDCNEYFANGVLVHNCDALRMLLATESLTATPLTDLQRRRVALKDHIQNDDLTLQKGCDDYSGILMRRGMELAEIERAEKDQQQLIARTVMNVLQAPAISDRFRR